MKLIFTVDLEDWRLAYDYKCNLDNEINKLHDSLLFSNLHYLLELLDGKKASFFILGKFAEKYPEALSLIVSEGHDIGIHGYDHRNISDMTIAEFEKDLKRCLSLIQQNSGILPEYYRAPNFSLTQDKIEYFKVLENNGIKLDSSIFPGRNSLVQKPKPYILNGLNEVPISSWNGIPCGGGAFFRFYPYKLFKNLIASSGRGTDYRMFYIHPWELGQSNINNDNSFLKKFRITHNIDKVKSRLKLLFDDFEITSISRFMDNRIQHA